MSLSRSRAKEKIDRARAQDILERTDATISWRELTKDDRRKTAEWRERVKAQIAGSGER